MNESRWQNSVVQQIESRVEAEIQLLKLSWNESLATGQPLIDQQHRRLIGIGNELVTAVTTRRSKSVVSNLLFELVEEVETHFKTEQQLLTDLGTPLPKGHVRMHQTLLSQAEQLRDTFVDGKGSTRDLIAFVMVDLLSEHAAKENLTLSYGEATPARLESQTGR